MGLPNLSRETKFSGTNVDMEICIFPVQLTTNRIGNLTRLIRTLATVNVITIHTYISCIDRELHHQSLVNRSFSTLIPHLDTLKFCSSYVDVSHWLRTGEFLLLSQSTHGQYVRQSKRPIWIS